MAAYWIGECTGLDFQVDEMQEYLASLQKEPKKVSSQSEKTYRYMMEWIQKNRKHFTWGRGSGATQYCDLSQSSKVDIYGKIQMDANGKAAEILCPQGKGGADLGRRRHFKRYTVQLEAS